MVMGVSGGGGGRPERGVEERALNDVSIDSLDVITLETYLGF